MCSSEDLLSRLDAIEEVILDDERSEIEDLIDSCDLDEAEGIIDELENERT